MAKAAAKQATEEDGLALLPGADVACLKARKLKATVVQEGGEILVVIKEFPVPVGYDHAKVDLLIRLPGQWPDGKPDMFYVDPPLAIQTTGGAPRATGKRVVSLGRTWQRWSRHIQSGWRPGLDGLENYLAMIDHELEREPGR